MAGYELDDLYRDWDNTDGEEIFEQQDSPELRAYNVRLARLDTDDPPRDLFIVTVTGKPCPCECSAGGFCGGCGHAGCGGR